MIAIGPERFRLPFGAVGFEMVEADASSFAEVFGRLAKDGSVGLIVCGESFAAEQSGDEFRELCLTSKAAVLVVPDGPESQGIGTELVRTAIERAAGVDLLSATEIEDSDH